MRYKYGFKLNEFKKLKEKNYKTKMNKNSGILIKNKKFPDYLNYFRLLNGYDIKEKENNDIYYKHFNYKKKFKKIRTKKLRNFLNNIDYSVSNNYMKKFSLETPNR